MFKGYSDEDRFTQFDPTNIHPYAAAWILGATVGCVDFQNYAMEQLYNHSCKQSDQPLVVTPAAMEKIMTGEPFQSPLRWFMEDFVCTHFGNEQLIKGEISGWIRLMQKCPWFLHSLMIMLRYRTNGGIAGMFVMLKVKEVYMIKNERKPLMAPTYQLNVVTPAKRGADGTPKPKEVTAPHVKCERADA
ncbi:sdr family [Pyrenophora seminiperda CCB06]|uniref:Sdr family n=1 Tax=Pyrenophora seminiperda CCB06 TaxID=1302712 RepID=A0A3M7MBA1_9PLEO|nr:sdr family [Pyrenophora seminiperda CCB06]